MKDKENINGVNETSLNDKPKKPKRKFLERRSSWLVMGLLIFTLIVLVGVLLGVPRGINDRISLSETQASPKIQSQIESAKLDLEEGRFEVALSRLDWILDEMSPFMSDEELAEIGELYSQALLQKTTYATPTPQPSPTPTEPVYTPTPDLRGQDELFENARQQIADEAWDEAIQTLEALRQKNLEYRTVAVDGMLYIALRNRGAQKILVEGSLEPGIYDLSLAERFAPLDSAAEGYRTWTRLYLTGASYWDVDWSQVVLYFEQVYPHLPNLRDGTNMTATERFRIGAIEYAIQLTELEEYCEAQEYFERAFALGPDPDAQETAQRAAEECWNELNPPTPEPTLDITTPEEPVAEVTPIPVEPTETPTVTPQTPTVEPPTEPEP